MLKINILSKISPDKLKIAAIIFIIALLICIAVITTHKKSSHEVIGETYLNNLDQVKVEIKGEVNMVGFVIDNIENGLVKQFHYHDISSLQNQDVILLDTRTPLEYERGHAEGFINIPVDDLHNRLCELDKSKKVYVMC